LVSIIGSDFPKFRSRSSFLVSGQLNVAALNYRQIVTTI
jgi:hypothetical protein